MTRQLTRENHRSRIDELLLEARRYERTAHQQAAAARYLEMAGNVCWHFAPEEAPGWFRQALALRREAGWEPSWLTAMLLWKLGLVDELDQETRRIVEINEARIAEMRASPRPVDGFKAREWQQRLRALLHEVAIACFLGRRFEESERWASDGIGEDLRWAQWDKAVGQPRSEVLTFIRDMSGATRLHDLDASREALAAFERQLRMWPSDAGDMETELYRFGQSLI